MRIILIKSKLKGPLIQAAAANPRRVFRMRLLEVALLTTLPKFQFPSLILPKGGSETARDQVYYENSAPVAKKSFCSSFSVVRGARTLTEQIKIKE